MTHPTLNIFTKKINPRLIYTVNEVFVRRLGLEPKLFNDQDAFQQAEGAKLNYSSELIDGDEVLNLPPAGLLFEKRIQAQEHEAFKQDHLLFLFPIKSHDLGFDPLAASFYHLSRYEEYLPHRNDEHGRFLEEDFLLVKHQAEDYPHVEGYAQLLGKWLATKFPILTVAGDQQSYQHVVTVDVDQLYALKQKGLARTVFGLSKDALQGKVGKRVAVLTGSQKDPNDIYDELFAASAAAQAKTIFFFQVGEGSRYDQNNPPHLSSVKDRMNRIAIQSQLGIHPSYYSSDDPHMLQKEIERLRSIVPSPVVMSRQHYLRFQLPDTFRRLQEFGIEEDYSIGFTTRNGFRAATCKPFRGFDLEREDIMEITFMPSCFMDLAAVRKHLRSEEAISAGQRLRATVRSFSGQFISTWHPEVLTGQGVDYPSMPILMELLEHD